MYRFVKQEQSLQTVEYFLYQQPLRIRNKLPEIVVEAESEIMKYMCKKTKKLVLGITLQLFPRTPLLDEFSR